MDEEEGMSLKYWKKPLSQMTNPSQKMQPSQWMPLKQRMTL
jgi:hypothetical protein